MLFMRGSLLCLQLLILHHQLPLIRTFSSLRSTSSPLIHTYRPLKSIRNMSGNTKSIKSFFAVKDSAESGKKRKVDEVSEVVIEDSIAKQQKRQPEEEKVVPVADVDPVEITAAASAASRQAASPEETVLAATGWPPMDNLEPSWRQRLLPEFQKPYFQRLMQFLATESKSHTVFPPSNQVFTALNLCPFDTVKVVVIGQDPYHGPGQAHGLAFSVQKGVQLPPSLRNMVTEAQKDPAVNIPTPTHGNLECWARQGVLMLNTVLTVRKAEANSHQKKGWEEFTDAIVRELGKKEGLVYLLWGKPAQTKCQGINSRQNKIITSSHPSPLSAYKTNEPFIGSKMFSRCNEALAQLQQEPIDWTIR